MKAIVLCQDTGQATKMAMSLSGRGFEVICLETRDAAQALITCFPVDLLIVDERVNGQLTHALCLSAERRNAGVATIMLTNKTRALGDELFDLLPCVRAQLGEDVPLDLIMQIVDSLVPFVDIPSVGEPRTSAEDLMLGDLPHFEHKAPLEAPCFADVRPKVDAGKQVIFA